MCEIISYFHWLDTYCRSVGVGNGGGKGGGLQAKLGWGMWPTSQNPYPLYDLTKNLIPSSWPNPLIKTLFQTWFIASYLVQTDGKRIVKGFCWWSWKWWKSNFFLITYPVQVESEITIPYLWPKWPKSIVH